MKTEHLQTNLSTFLLARQDTLVISVTEDIFLSPLSCGLSPTEK